MPKISYNLLSISKIIKDLHCQAIFSPNAVSFQDLNLRRWLALPSTVGDSTYLMMMLSLGIVLGLVSCLIFPFFKTIVCHGIFVLAIQIFNIWNIFFLTCFLKWMFLHCLVMFVIMQNDLGSHFPLNPTNLPNPLPLSIAMFKGPPGSVLPQGNVGLLPSSMIIPISLRSFPSLINLRSHRSSNIFTPRSRPYSTQRSVFYIVITVENTWIIPFMSFCPLKGLSTKVPALVPVSKMG